MSLFPADHPVWNLLRLAMIFGFATIVLSGVQVATANEYDWTEERDAISFFVGSVVSAAGLLSAFGYEIKIAKKQ